MSGGVDSSVAAALLCRDPRNEVVGAFMKQWSDTKEISGLCSWKRDRRDAVRVAAELGIPLMTLDFEKEYKEEVIGYMFAEYERGRTPNPDVLCNVHIKFGAWLREAVKLGFDCIATGHYAGIEKTDAGCRLLAAKDKDKDQTYFLHRLTQEQLGRAIFPVGDYTKKEVRRLARKFHLPTAEREESMGICFVGEMPMKEFLSQKIKPKRGPIILADGTRIGEHDGLAFATIGQRHGLGLGGGEPMYVVQKKHETNTLVVGHAEDPLLYAKDIFLTDMHWVSGQPPSFPLKCEVRLRHRQPPQKAVIAYDGARYTLTFRTRQRAAAPGQFAVFYHQNNCLGGGVIG